MDYSKISKHDKVKLVKERPHYTVHDINIDEGWIDLISTHSILERVELTQVDKIVEFAEWNTRVNKR